MSAEPEKLKVVVVGAGVAGMTAAYRLAQARAVEVVLLEATNRLGGTISTTSFEGAVIENGPDSFITTKPSAKDLCIKLGLEQNIIPTDSRFRRAFIAWRGRLHRVPEAFFMLAPGRVLPLLQSDLFSPLGKARILSEVLVPAKSSVADESLSSFVRRRLGREALERLAQPMVGGIYTADPEKLSLLSTFPQFLEYEAKYGSVIVGLQELDKQKLLASGGDSDRSEEAGARYSIFATLDQGLGLLVDRLAHAIGAQNIRLGTKVEQIFREANLWNVRLSSGETLSAHAVIVAVPTDLAAQMLGPCHAQLSADLDSIEHASSAILNLVYRRRDIGNALDGFGFVVPAVEKSSILACSYASVKFPNRAPEGMACLRVFFGGALEPHMYSEPEGRLLDMASRDLRRYLRIKAAPVWHNLTRWTNAMPQYHVGHKALVASLEEKVARLPGLYLAGNGYAGVGLPDCISSGQNAAECVLERQGVLI